MYVTQPIVPRCKEWLPLATNQLRLRNLIQIIAFSIKRKKENFVNMKEFKTTQDQRLKCESYYYTLHSTIMSAPFYTSEKVHGDSPKWKEIEVNSFAGNVSNSADAFVIRLWSTPDVTCEKESNDQVVAVWGVYMNGLTYLGPNLGADISLKPNSVVFLMPGGYFTDINCLESQLKIRYISVTVNSNDIQQSYTVNSLTRLHSIQQVIKKELAEVDSLKQKISMGDFFMSETRGRTMLRRLLNKNKPRVNHQDYVKMKENIEIAKYRVRVLKEEKSVLFSSIKELKNRIEILSDENQIMESRIMENYRLLMRKVQIQRELKREYVSQRESQLHSKAKLTFRAKQLISELNLIYPIVEKFPEKYTICGVHLPNSEDFAGHDDIQISVALGFVTHVIQMISVFLEVPLRYPVVHLGSRSRIIDHISEKIPDSEREFPLYLRGKEKLQFHYAVYLLNKNIAQLRWLCGLPTLDLRNTLSNLSSLVKIKSGNSDVHNSNRSLSSSVADACGSYLNRCSPVGGITSFSNEKDGMSCSVLESCAKAAEEDPSTQPSKAIPGHRVSKSAGSANDLMITFFPVRNQYIESNSLAVKGTAINNSFSYSLDKGLNEYTGVSGVVMQPPKYVEPKTCVNCAPATRRGETKTCESRETDEFLESWEADNRCSSFSDDDCDMNAADFHGFQTVPFGKKTTRKTEVALMDFNGVYIPDAGSKAQDLRESKDGMEYAQARVQTTKVIVPSEKAQEAEASEESIYEEEKHLMVTDSLLENVTTRTEALANQTTSFNRFRNRFKSTVENLP